MTSILTSLHGNKLGLDPNQALVKPAGSASGVDGYQMFELGRAYSAYTDDFLGDLLSAEWDAKTGSDGGVVTPTINVQKNGVVRMVTGAGATLTMAVNGVQLQQSLNWAAPLQYELRKTVIHARVKMSAVAQIAIFIGFTDQTSALEMPINGSGSGDAWTTTATDAIGVVYDSAMTTKNWWGMGVANDVDSTGQNFGVAPTLAVYEDWHIELMGDGTATGSVGTFYRNGVSIAAATPASNNSALVSGPRNTIPLSPVIAAFSRSAASVNVDIDILHMSMARV